MKIEQMEWGALLKNYRERANFHAMAFARIWYPDPEGYTWDTLHSKGAVNAGHYANPEGDRLLEAQSGTTDMPKRVAIWADLQRLWAQDVPIIWPYAMRTRYNVWQPALKGFTPMANASRVSLRQAWIDR
jgi:peptide/nickel transport system substrate-binding protein